MAEMLAAEICRVLEEEFEVIPVRRLALLTSGGDLPGMNAAIWGAVRTAMRYDMEVVGVTDGYRGLVEGLAHRLTWGQVCDIMTQSGTILGTARLPEFKNEFVRTKALETLTRKHISGLIVIGGDGSMKGASALTRDLRQRDKVLQTIAIPGTIDNDLWGTDMSLGASTAANAMVSELRNMIRPAQALRRIFVCEVMGRYSGYLALQAGLGIGADAVIIPEEIVDAHRSSLEMAHSLDECISLVGTEDNLRRELDKTAKLLELVFARGKRYGFVILAEGIGQLTHGELDSDYVRRYLEDRIKDWTHPNRPDVRAHVLGYPVRGASPSRYDIWLGATLGAAAVQCLLDGKSDVMVGWSDGSGVIETPFAEVIAKSNRPPGEIWTERPQWQELLRLQRELARPPALRR